MVRHLKILVIQNTVQQTALVYNIEVDLIVYWKTSVELIIVVCYEERSQYIFSVYITYSCKEEELSKIDVI